MKHHVSGYSKNLDNGQWTVDDCITVRPPPESCTGIISDLPYGSLLSGQHLIFGPSSQLNWRLTDCSAYRVVCGIPITAKWLVETGEIPLPMYSLW
jgi:hypothetical protein